MKILVSGSTRLKGQIMVNASKNAILPILAASILSSGTVVIRQVPLIRDVHIISALIHQMGLKVEYSQDKLIISGIPQHNVPDYELSRQIRASFLLMGPLLARRGQVRISLPGGCAIGTRPIDLHLKGFEALGASIKMCYRYRSPASRDAYLSRLSQCRSDGKYYDGGRFSQGHHLHRKCCP